MINEVPKLHPNTDDKIDRTINHGLIEYCTEFTLPMAPNMPPDTIQNVVKIHALVEDELVVTSMKSVVSAICITTVIV